MRNLFNRIPAILIFVLVSTLNLRGQNEYARQNEIMYQFGALVSDKKNEDALSLLQQNKELFQYDEITELCYNWLNGVILYRTDKYSESRPYIAAIVSLLDNNETELSNPNLRNYLQAYYFIFDIDLKLGADIDVLTKELDRAKYIYEVANATSDPVYSRITAELRDIKESDIDVAAEALNILFAGDYQKAIPIIQQAIDHYKVHQPDNYNHIATWMRLLGWSYMNVGDYNNSERTYLSALKLLESKNLQNIKDYRKILDDVSVLYANLQNYDKAIAFNTEAKTLYEKALDFGDDYVRCVSNCALCHNGLGHNNIAKMMLNVALRQARQNLSDTTAISPSLTDLNQLSNKKIDATTIDNNFFIQTRIIPYVTLLSNSAVVYSELGYFSDAIRAVKESISISEDYGLKDAMPYNNMGMLYFYKSKFPQAVEWFRKSYELSHTPHESDEVGMNTALGLFLSNDSSASSFCSTVSDRMRSNIQDMFAFMSGAERAVYWKHFENYLPMLKRLCQNRRSLFFMALRLL